MPYASAEVDLPRLGMSADMLAGIPIETQREAISAACAVADGYLRAQYEFPLVWEIAALGAVVAGGNGDAFDLGDTPSIYLALDVLSGDGATLDVSLETSDDAATWSSAGAFAQVTDGAAARQLKAFGSLKRYVRAAWVVSGAFTFSVTFEGGDLKSAVCRIAAYDLMAVRGFAPEGPDANIRLRYEDSTRWLQQVATGRIQPAYVDTTSDTDEGGPIAISPRARGW